MNATNEIRKEAEKAYKDVGPSAVYELGNRLGLDYGHCRPCEAETPTLKGECLLCGEPNILPES